MKDFTISIYRRLLDALQAKGYHFKTFRRFLENPDGQFVILRHDIDWRKEHALQFARIQYDAGIVGSYYFRMIPQSFDIAMIREISDMGHEIGYHYEDMDTAKGDPEKAILFFKRNLEKLREIAPIETICMHGSPQSKFDNRDIWKFYDYRNYGIAGEPYFDINFKQVFYLTDTGRMWNGHKVSVRDKVENHFGLSFRHTDQIIECITRDTFPEKVMFNFHPQRWTENKWLWHKEKYCQEMKNIIKSFIIKRKA